MDEPWIRRYALESCKGSKQWVEPGEVEWGTEGYFRGFDKTYYLKGIEELKDRWTCCIQLKREYSEKLKRFLPKQTNSCSFYHVNINTLVPYTGCA